MANRAAEAPTAPRPLTRRHPPGWSNSCAELLRLQITPVIDKLAVMPERFVVAAVGATIEIDVSSRSKEFQQRALEAWKGALSLPEARPDVVVVVDQELDDNAALARLSTEVTIAALSRRRGQQLWMLHAAGLADASGRVVVLSGPSGAGKTTAAQHLARRYAYISDETIGLSADGGVVPYRKPLSLIEPGVRHKSQKAPSSIGSGLSVPERLQAAKIVVLDRQGERERPPTVEPLGTIEALELLAPQTSYLSEGQAPLRLMCALLEGTGGAVRLRYRDVSEIDEVIDSLFRTAYSPQGLAPKSTHKYAGRRREGEIIIRAEVVDEIDIADHTALLLRTPTGGKISVLAGIGPAIWGAASGRSLEEITDQVTAIHGAPENAASLVATAVESLIRDGLLIKQTI